MAKEISPAQMRAAYTAIMGMSGVDAAVLEELQGIHDETVGFTSAEICAYNADSFADLAALAGYKLDKLESQEKKGNKENKAVKAGPANPGDHTPSKLTPHQLNAQKAKMLGGAEFEVGATVNVKDSRTGFPHEAAYAGKIGTVDSVAVSTAPGGRPYLSYVVAIGSSLAVVGKNGLAKAIPFVEPVPAPKKLLANLDDEECRLLVRENDRQARQARKEADLADYKKLQLEKGRPAAEVEALTHSDMREKRTLSEIAKSGAGHLVHGVIKHVVSKAPTLRASNADLLRQKREALEWAATDKVAVYAREMGKEVAQALKEYAEALAAEEKENPETK